MFRLLAPGTAGVANAGTAAASGGGGGLFGSLMSFLPIILMFVALYFFMIRPNKKQEKEAANMRNSLEVGDEITTIGGIIGKVVSIKEETLVLETSRDGTKIRILKSAVRNVDVHAADAAN
ncbi:MAG: preprotein translocase subunit YajC [Clostridia bacterium]|nr:preprotein translocase subunit YajC [Clostridia bacterium]